MSTRTKRASRSKWTQRSTLKSSSTFVFCSGMYFAITSSVTLPELQQKYPRAHRCRPQSWEVRHGVINYWLQQGPHERRRQIRLSPSLPSLTPSLTPSLFRLSPSLSFAFPSFASPSLFPSSLPPSLPFASLRFYRGGAGQ
jgi:hypothetical protein